MTTTAAVELAAQIRRLSSQLLAEVAKRDTDVDIALVLAHLATATDQQSDVADLLADRATLTDGKAWEAVGTDAHSAAYFLGVAARRFTSAQVSAEGGQEVLAREVAAARQAPAVSSEPELIARLQAEQQFVDRVWAEQKAAGLHPVTSGAANYREWRESVVKSCTCDDTAVVSAGCPVHAEALVILAG
jgi:hypothetical protein